MTLAMAQFVPWMALLGGAIIGAAAALLILFNGRIAGISGIVGALLRPVRGDIGWRIAFVGGLLAAPLVFICFAPLPPVAIDAGYPLLAGAGLLVGLGARYGAGCTAATAFAAWRACRRVRWPRRSLSCWPVSPPSSGCATCEGHTMMQFLSAAAAGLLFGLGLIVSGMSDPARVLAFLDLAGAWNPSLAFVMAGAVLVALPAFQYAARRRSSLLGLPMQLSRARSADPRLLLGSLAFGAGWGMAGLCPGPALASLLAWQPKALVFVLAMLAGMACFEWLERHKK